MIFRKNIVKFWCIFCIILAVALGTITVVHRWHKIFPSKEVSEIYARYENVEGVDVSFVKDYKVNDTIFIDVTLLEAKDSNGWNIICEDFLIPELDPITQSMIEGREDVFFTKLIEKEDISHSSNINSNGNILRSVSYEKKMLCIFHVKNEEEEHAVFYHNFDKSTKEID